MSKAAKGKTTKAPEEEASNKDKNREELYEEALAKMRKTYGDGSIMVFGDSTEEAEETTSKVEVIPTGILPVDRVTRVGGIPRGRITEILGPEMSGKTTLCLHVIQQAQAMGGKHLYVDMEHALEPGHVSNIGVKKLNIAQPDTGEDALSMVEDGVKSGVIDVIVIDSVASLVPRAELEGSMGDSHMGLQARLMSQALRKLTGNIARSKTCVIFINQIRHKIGVMFGSPETTTGGNALKFYSSLRLDMRKIQVLTSGSDAYANTVKVKAIKNKVGPPYAVEEFTMYYDAKKTVASGIVDMGSKLGVITKAGTWYSYNGERLGQGAANVTEFLLNNKPILDEIAAICRDPNVLNTKLMSVEQQQEIM